MNLEILAPAGVRVSVVSLDPPPLEIDEPMQCLPVIARPWKRYDDLALRPV